MGAERYAWGAAVKTFRMAYGRGQSTYWDADWYGSTDNFLLDDFGNLVEIVKSIEPQRFAFMADF